MYHWRVFLWENGYKSTEYTKHVVAPIFLEDRLDETLDTGEIILKNMPIATREAFPPKTKFRLERYTTENYIDKPKTWDMVVDHDDVEEYEGCPEICTHRIYLIEASVIAQGMHVDNIAFTYELQDVDLSYKTGVSTDATIGDDAIIKDGLYEGTPTHDNEKLSGSYPHKDETVVFSNSYRFIWYNTDSVKKLLLNIDVRNDETVRFELPRLKVQYYTNTQGWTDLCEIGTETVIKRVIFDFVEPTSSKDGEIIATFRREGTAYTFTQISANEYYTVANVEGDLCVCPTLIRQLDSSGTYLNFNALYTHTQNQSLTFAKSKGTLDDEAVFVARKLSDSDVESYKRCKYFIECKPINIKLFQHLFVMNEIIGEDNFGTMVYRQYIDSHESYINNASGDKIYLAAAFYAADFGGIVAPFYRTPQKYNCYNLIRKAMLTCDTQIFNNNEAGLDNIEYSITMNDDTAASLRSITVYETVFEQKNLWEVLLQSGYYKHAIPRLDFATDGTDRFELKYRQLGATEKKEDSSNKITVFNSRTLSEFFTQYDSYVTNLFSPQNVIDEWGVAKTSAGSYLVSNNTAEFCVKYPLQEITVFELSYKGSEYKSALDMIFEESVYSILTPNKDVRPSKACALYYKLGDTKIVGLNYVPPSVNGDAPYALKTILNALFGVDTKSDIQFNDIHYHIKYRTQDSLRVSQARPDLQNFMKNSSYEKYPHHEQYYGQQDKIIDSERFTANLFGKLIRVGNAVYQRQECADAESEKKSGDLVEINSEPYYVTATENEYYADVILQKVTYSKNFNQISNIVTIPSEPRFYEVSERSQVRREVRLMDFLLLTTEENKMAANPKFMNNSKWRDIAKSVIFADGHFDLPNFAYTRFKADKKRSHNGVQDNQLFPSSEVIHVNDNYVIPKNNSDHRDVIVPLLHFPLKNAIVFEWDMDDNFKAGDSIDTQINGGEEDNAYYSMQSVRYCDIYGRADLFTFRLFYKTDWTIKESRRLPFAETADFVPPESESAFYLPDSLSIGLDKDNREALSFNYQINLLQENDTFVTYSNLFGQKNSRLKMCLLSIEASLFDGGVAINAETIVADNVAYSLVNTTRNAIEIRIPRPANISASAVKSIVLYEKDGNSKYACIAKNVSKVEDEHKFDSWWIYPIFSD